MKTVYNLDLTEYNSYKIHSIAALALFPECREDFLHIIQTYDISKINIIGKGCNTIFAREYYSADSPLVIIRDNYSKIELTDGQLYVLAGTDLKDLSMFAMEHSLTGLEYFYDIPGCVGGAITMNAGSCGVSITDYITEIEYIDCDSCSIKKMTKADLCLDYRKSFFKNGKNYFILSCTFNLPSGDKNLIMQSMKEIEVRRIAKQPREYPNAGSVFIRPSETTYVGPMIEKLGLKGYKIGGAEISRKHAGFIVNVDNAKGLDIVQLIDYIKKAIYDCYSINLETEQRIII